MARRIVIGLSGASGIMIGVRLLEVLATAGIETHLVASKSALVTLAYEMDMKWAAVRKLAHAVYDNEDVTAAIASGSFRTMGMIVAPCSMKTLGVALKERRRLTLVPRETPLHLGHLRNMTAVTEMGAIIAPPVPAFYARPKSMEEMVDQLVGRLLDLYDLDVGLSPRWKDDQA
jgi:flavin prenyltransferase